MYANRNQSTLYKEILLWKLGFHFKERLIYVLYSHLKVDLIQEPEAIKYGLSQQAPKHIYNMCIHTQPPTQTYTQPPPHTPLYVNGSQPNKFRS